MRTRELQARVSFSTLTLSPCTMEPLPAGVPALTAQQPTVEPTLSQQAPVKITSPGFSCCVWDSNATSCAQGETRSQARSKRLSTKEQAQYQGARGSVPSKEQAQYQGAGSVLQGSVPRMLSQTSSLIWWPVSLRH